MTGIFLSNPHEQGLSGLLFQKCIKAVSGEGGDLDKLIKIVKSLLKI